VPVGALNDLDGQEFLLDQARVARAAELQAARQARLDHVGRMTVGGNQGPNDS
jgi:hypothetical protein